MPWIKAVDRLPGYNKIVRVKFKDGDTEWPCDIFQLLEEVDSMKHESIHLIEWFDDSPNPILEEVKAVRQFFRKNSPLTEMMDEIIEKYSNSN